MASLQKFIELSPPPIMVDKFMPRQWSTWFTHLFDRLGSGPFGIQGYNKASLIGAPAKIDPRLYGSLTSSLSFTSLVWVRDLANPGAGATTGLLAYSDGTNWRRVFDNAIVV